jgi:hypothetical protein
MLATLDKEWRKSVGLQTTWDLSNWLREPCECVWVIDSYRLEVEPGPCHKKKPAGVR